MDNSTYEVRLANWQSIVERCSARPEGQTVKQWLEINGIKEKQYYYWQRKVRRAAADTMHPQLPALRQKSEVSLAEIHLEAETDTAPNQAFIPAAVIRTERATIEISAFAPPALTARILKAVSHAV